ncbi:MAG: hypothetical protein R3C53_15250 [Pirellulaceae bacterium]
MVKAHALLVLARIEDAAQNGEQLQAALQQAKTLRDSEQFNVKDREQLDAAVRLMSSATQRIWFEAS